ncbi:hypothetical protein [Roseimaritima sediminicola]|uniref:hypothetical protein n=1 Tax=Roseimaritima sediminicola TaxID=2662066 RepID=UPI0012982E81|nr:hypothetical protein [Roseimaritima sediminicola]
MNTTAKWILTFALVMPAATWGTASTTRAGGLDCLGCSHCPRCDNGCTLSVDRADADRHCWQVEYEQVCIPKIVFPWQKPDCHGACVHNGARVRTVKVLKKHTYTCPECEYTWTPRRVACCGSCSHGPSAVEDAPLEDAPVEEAPTTSLLQIRHVQAVGFFRDLLK